MTDGSDRVPDTAPVQDPGSEAESSVRAEPARPRSWFRSLGTGVRRVLMLLAILLAVAFVTTITVDLGPSVRGLAERRGAAFLKRQFTIGTLSIRLLTGTFIVEDLRIGGLDVHDRPFLTARRIEVSMSFSALLHREVLVDSVVMSDWAMLVESWPNGRHSFPKFTPDSTGPKGPKRFTTTVSYVLAQRGQFTYDDHGTPWSTVARNLEVTVSKSRGYGGSARFTGGTVAIQQYLPMTASMDSVFTIDGGLVKFSRINLTADGSRSDVTGVVDLGKWPEQTWNVHSVVQFPRMREIFFARESWQLAGEGHFNGVFHLFKGGRSLTGEFTSPETHVNGLVFPQLKGQLRWLPDRFEVFNAQSRFYGGGMRFEYALAPLGSHEHPHARFVANYDAVNLSTLSNALEWPGIRLAGAMSGRTTLEWPLGRFVDRRGDGDLQISSPDGVTVLTRSIPSQLLADELTRPRPWGPFNGEPRLLGDVPVGGELHFALNPGSITVKPSTMATPRTFVSFQGRTAYGDASDIPFHVTSADWGESDRVLAGIMTAFGAQTGAVPVSGTGEFDGVMRLSFRKPRIEGHFTGDRMRAWDVTWGRGTADLIIEDSYVALTNARVTDGTSLIETEGRFALGYPRKDGGEEINARIRTTRWRLTDLRHAFTLDDWPLDGRLSGEFHLYGKYESPFGFGRLQIDEGAAWHELFETADGVAALRRQRGSARWPGCHQGRRTDDGRRLRRMGRHLFLHGVGTTDTGGNAECAELPRGAAVGPAGLHVERQRAVRVATLRRETQRRGSVSQGRRRRRAHGEAWRAQRDAQPRARRRVAAPGRLRLGSRRAHARSRRRTDLQSDRHVARPVHPRISAGAVALHDGRGERHGPHRRRAPRPRAPAHRRACRRPDASPVRLRGPQRRPGPGGLRPAERRGCRSSGWWAKTHVSTSAAP